jgi:hypothetical protein
MTSPPQPVPPHSVSPQPGVVPCAFYAADRADRLAPEGRESPCRESTTELAEISRQARLAMILATEVPAWLSQELLPFANTLILGRFNAAPQIAKVQDLAARRGGRAEDIGRLGPDQVYVAAEGSVFRKIIVPCSLSHHPEGLGLERALS